MVGMLVCMAFASIFIVGDALSGDDENSGGSGLERVPEKEHNAPVTADRPFLPPPENEIPIPVSEEPPHMKEAVETYRSGDPAGYNIDIDFEGQWTGDEQTAFKTAADYISHIIVKDVPSGWGNGETVDDLKITAVKDNIDGKYGILGSASVKAVRGDSLLPTHAELKFDTPDITRLQNRGDWDSTVLHEMFHALGFGVTWQSQGLVSNDGAPGIRFTGENATHAYNTEYDDVSKDQYRHVGVPIEEHGGAGTRGSHWDEDVFDDEFMTGILDHDSHISQISIAALEDMGYDTIYDNISKIGDATGQFGYA